MLECRWLAWSYASHFQTTTAALSSWVQKTLVHSCLPNPGSSVFLPSLLHDSLDLWQAGGWEEETQFDVNVPFVADPFRDTCSQLWGLTTVHCMRTSLLKSEKCTHGWVERYHFRNSWILCLLSRIIVVGSPLGQWVPNHKCLARFTVSGMCFLLWGMP